MDNHSKKLRLMAAVGAVVCLFQCSAFAGAYYSFGKSVNKSFGSDPNRVKTSLVENIFVPINGTVLDLNLAIDIEHPSICDLKIYIINPAGSIAACIHSYDVRTFKDGLADYHWTIFDAEAPVSIYDGSSPFSGLFRPSKPNNLSGFYGQQSFGNWQVQVDDWVYVTNGIFKGVRLDFCIEPIQSVQLNPEPTTISVFCLGGAMIFLRRKSAA
ncbi:MAG: proprotein convertase P-domain-containing protein [Phycisphaerae bacterium]|nr:proprotein convertase P-domain-containing protein [Phycisphaerae bacterium]